MTRRSYDDLDNDQVEAEQAAARRAASQWGAPTDHDRAVAKEAIADIRRNVFHRPDERPDPAATA